MTEREFAIAVVQRLRDAGHQALWAGGCVRDEILGLIPKDYDVASDARPEEVQRLFRRTVAVGASFGVIEVLGPRVEDQFLKVQVATFRTDVGYSDGRRPDQVVFASAREDALRRDFTINGMFFDPIEGQLIDYVGGQADLHARILRAIGSPEVRFEEDKLRMLRAIRIATRFELAIEPATMAAIQKMAGQITVVSAERIAEELRQLLVHPRRARGMNLMFDLGLVPSIFPELLPLKELPLVDEAALLRSTQPLSPSPQRNKAASSTGEKRSLWDHVMDVLDNLGPDTSFELAMAGLLHEIGPAQSEPQKAIAARLADTIAERLRLSNPERDRIVWLVRNHRALCPARTMRICHLKIILAHPGIRELLVLHRAAAAALEQSLDHVQFCEDLLGRWTESDLNPPPLVTGNDLLDMGLEPGPIFKVILDKVREAQLDGTIRTREEALALVQGFLAGNK